MRLIKWLFCERRTRLSKGGNREDVRPRDPDSGEPTETGTGASWRSCFLPYKGGIPEPEPCHFGLGSGSSLYFSNPSSTREIVNLSRGRRLPTSPRLEHEEKPCGDSDAPGEGWDTFPRAEGVAFIQRKSNLKREHHQPGFKDLDRSQDFQKGTWQDRSVSERFLSSSLAACLTVL